MWYRFFFVPQPQQQLASCYRSSLSVAMNRIPGNFSLRAHILWYTRTVSRSTSWVCTICGMFFAFYLLCLCEAIRRHDNQFTIYMHDLLPLGAMSDATTIAFTRILHMHEPRVKQALYFVSSSAWQTHLPAPASSFPGALFIPMWRSSGCSVCVRWRIYTTTTTTTALCLVL